MNETEETSARPAADDTQDRGAALVQGGGGRLENGDTFFPWLVRTARLWGFVAFIVVTIVIFREVALPFVIAILIAYVFSPVLKKLCRLQIRGRQLPRFLWLIFLYLVIVGVVGLFLTSVVPRVAEDLKRVGAEAPQFLKRLRDTWVPALESWVGENLGHRPVAPVASKASASRRPRFRIKKQEDGSVEIEAERLEVQLTRTGDHSFVVHMPKKNEEQKSGDVSKYFDGLLAGMSLRVTAILSVGQRIVGLLVSTVMSFVLVLMISAFLLLDPQRILAWFSALVPGQYRRDYDNVFRLLDHALGGAIRGQLLVCLVNGVLTGAGLVLCGVKYPFLLALLAAVMSLIPIFGSILSSIPIAIVALVSGGEGIDFLRGAMILLWIIGIHLLEANFLNPKIIGTAARIHPVVVIFAVAAGQHTYGVSGALLAVPIASSVHAVFTYLRDKSNVDPLSSRSGSSKNREGGS